jgi:hypothetical protein
MLKIVCLQLLLEVHTEDATTTNSDVTMVNAYHNVTFVMETTTAVTIVMKDMEVEEEALGDKVPAQEVTTL